MAANWRGHTVAPNSSVAPRPREGRLTEPKAGVQPWPRERVLMPLNRPCRRDVEPAQLGRERSFVSVLLTPPGMSVYVLDISLMGMESPRNRRKADSSYCVR